MKSISLLLFLFAPICFADSQNCVYDLDPASVHIGWTAFKTTQKIAVKGSFKSVEVHGKAKNKNLSTFLKKLKVTVDSTSVDTGNPARDKTLVDAFFSHLAKPITGQIKKVSVKDKTFDLALTLNGQTKEIPFSFELTQGGAFTSSGQMDILDFSGNSALAALNQQCSDLHKGPDGVSKTWSAVSLNFGAQFQIKCN